MTTKTVPVEAVVCCGNWDSLVDAPECRDCPSRKAYMKPYVHPAALSDERIREIAQKAMEQASTVLFRDSVEWAIREALEAAGVK